MWLAQVNAHGAYAWHAMTGTPDTHYDRRNLPIHAEFNAFLKEHEAYFRDAVPLAPVALLWSRTSLERYGADEPEARFQHEFFGFCEALLGHGIPFTVIPEQFLTDDGLEAYDTLVLPNAACLSDAAAAAIRRFVEAGKGLVASFATGLYDAEARPLENGALQALFGVEFTGHQIGGQSASYGRIEQPDHPLFAGIGETQLVPNAFGFCNVQVEVGSDEASVTPGTGGRRAPLTPREGGQDGRSAAAVLLTLVPPFAPLGGVGAPPERASIPTDRTSVPLAVQRGRALYFANEIGKLAWRYRLPDHGRLIANAVRAVSPRPFPAELQGAPYGVQLSLFRQHEPSRVLCHLVNTCGAGTVRHDLVPVRNVRLRVPEGTRRAHALALGAELAMAEGMATLPVLLTWEIVAVER
jgi:hypothetical protein